MSDRISECDKPTSVIVHCHVSSSFLYSLLLGIFVRVLYIELYQALTNLRHQVAMTKFCKVWLQILPHVTFSRPEFWNGFYIRGKSQL